MEENVELLKEVGSVAHIFLDRQTVKTAGSEANFTSWSGKHQSNVKPQLEYILGDIDLLECQELSVAGCLVW